MSFEDFKKSRDEKADNLDARIAVQGYRATFKHGYNKGFTDPLVEAMESDIEKLYQIAVREHDMYPMRVCEFLEEIYLNGSYAAYREAKAKVKESQGE